MHTKVDEIRKCLDGLLPRKDCVLAYDCSLVDQLPDILRENFGITSMTDGSRAPHLERLFGLLLSEGTGARDIASLPKLLEEAGIDKREFIPEVPRPIMEENEKSFSRWSTITKNEDLDSVLMLQRDLGRGQYNPQIEGHAARWEQGNSQLKHYLRGVTSVPPSLLERLTRSSHWELWIRWWKWRGMLNTHAPSLSIGPRWVTEIEFFRKIVGFESHVGLDLFSNDHDLVKVGDMHMMPFPERHFQFIFIKNTVDKSYSVRQLVKEFFRVMQPGGVLIVDQICGYGDCSPLTRTDIQKSENLLRLFRAQGKVEVLVQSDIDLTNTKGAIIKDRAKNNARLALRLF